MPKLRIVLFKDDDGTVPLIEFLKSIPQRQREKLIARVERLRDLGRELRRPEADYLRDDIYELRVRFGHTNYRVLYFFHGNSIAVLAAGITKEEKVPPREIDRVVKKRGKYIQNPERYSFEFQEGAAE